MSACAGTAGLVECGWTILRWLGAAGAGTGASSLSGDIARLAAAPGAAPWAEIVPPPLGVIGLANMPYSLAANACFTGTAAALAVTCGFTTARTAVNASSSFPACVEEDAKSSCCCCFSSNSSRHVRRQCRAYASFTPAIFRICTTAVRCGRTLGQAEGQWDDPWSLKHCRPEKLYQSNSAHAAEHT